MKKIVNIDLRSPAYPRACDVHYSVGHENQESTLLSPFFLHQFITTRILPNSLHVLTINNLRATYITHLLT